MSRFALRLAHGRVGSRQPIRRSKNVCKCTWPPATDANAPSIEHGTSVVHQQECPRSFYKACGRSTPRGRRFLEDERGVPLGSNLLGGAGLAQNLRGRGVAFVNGALQRLFFALGARGRGISALRFSVEGQEFSVNGLMD